MTIFLSLGPLLQNKNSVKKVVGLLIILFISSTFHFGIKIVSVISSSPNPLSHNKVYLYIRLCFMCVCGLTFAYLSQKVLLSVVMRTANKIDAFQKGGKASNMEFMESIDHHFVLYQAYRLKILISLYCCIILYNIIKSFFQFGLNEAVPEALMIDKSQYSFNMYYQEQHVYYSSQNKDETRMLGYVQIFEYGFRIMFGFFIPVVYVLQIFTKESQGPVRSNSMRSQARSEREISKIQKEVIEPIYGLQYFT